LHGAESKDFLIHEPGAFIAKSLEKETLPCPDGHIGFYTYSETFATDFVKNFCETSYPK
jgi:hypothetical protein